MKDGRSSEDAGAPNFWLLYGRDCRRLSFAARRMSWGKNSFLSVPSSTRIQRLRPLLPVNDAYIKVKRMVYLSDQGEIFAQHTR